MLFSAVPTFKVAVASVYRPPSVNIKQSIEDLSVLLTQLSPHSQYIVLAGDLNIDLLQQSNHHTNYIDCLNDFQLRQLFTEPSRVCPLSSTLIDHIACSSKLAVSRVLQTIGVSDHRIQVVEVDVQPLRGVPENKQVRAFRRVNWDDVQRCLATAPWSTMDMFDDVNDMWEYFHAILCQCLDQYAPLRAFIVNIQSVTLPG